MKRVRFKRHGIEPSPFVCLAHSVLIHPPIQHHGRERNEQHLAPFEFAIGSALIATARQVLKDMYHAQSFAAGAEAIEREKREAERYQDAWQQTNKRRRRGEHASAPKMGHTFKLEATYKPMQRSKAISRAGRERYSQYKKALRMRPVSNVITVELSSYAILRQAGLVDSGSNLRRVNAALIRVSQPVKVRGERWPAILTDFQQLKSGKWRLQVCGAWLPTARFEKVMLPLPVRASPTALALYLMLHWFDMTPSRERGISIPTLYARLGISTRWGRAACQRALENALDIVNKHLDALHKKGRKVPERYRIVGEGEHIRFRAVPRLSVKEEQEHYVPSPIEYDRWQKSRVDYEGSGVGG
jgi:hypothetical protein